MPEPRRLSPLARALQLMVVAALLYVLGQTMVEAQQATPTPREQAAALAAEAAPAPAPTPALSREEAMAAPGAVHGEYDRPTDEAIQATRLLEEAKRGHQLADDEIDFDMLRDTRLPRRPPPVFREDLAAKDGQRVRLVGFMSPYNSLRDMRNFMLMPSATGCFFCTPPSPREVAFVRMAPQDDPLPFESRPIEVTGDLRLWRDGSDDAAHRMFLFVLDNASIKPIDLAAELSRRAEQPAAAPTPAPEPTQ